VFDDDTKGNWTDSKILKDIVTKQLNLCYGATLAADNRKCSDLKMVDSYTMKTNGNRKVYFGKVTYTLEWGNYLPGQEHSIVKIFGLIYDGKGSWVLKTESFEQVADAHYDEIIHMMKSFSLESQSQPTPDPTGAQSEPYMGAIVELDKVVYNWTEIQTPSVQL
jgi:hypothetical protein